MRALELIEALRAAVDQVTDAIEESIRLRCERELIAELRNLRDQLKSSLASAQALADKRVQA